MYPEAFISVANWSTVMPHEAAASYGASAFDDIAAARSCL